MSHRSRLRCKPLLYLLLVCWVVLGLCIDTAWSQTDPPGISAVCRDDSFDTLEPLWLTTHLGDSDQGAATVVGGRLEVSGDGTSLFHNDDNGFFVYQEANGNFRVEVDILKFPVDQGGDYRKGGLMIRQGTAADSPRVMIQFIPHAPIFGSHQTMLQFDYRDANGVTEAIASNVLELTLPLRLAIDRRGDTFGVYYSTDGGTTWIRPLGGSGGSIDIAMTDPVLAGMAVASYDSTQELTAAFDDFRMCRPNAAPAAMVAASKDCDGTRDVDIVYALDLSGSMTASYPGSSSRLAAAQQAITDLNSLIAQQSPGSRAALVTYSGRYTVADNLADAVTVHSGLTHDLAGISSLVNGFDAASIDADASTPTALAVGEIHTLLATEHDGVRRPVVVFLTDGVPNIDGDGRGPVGYDIEEIQDISLRDGQGNFLPWSAVAWTGRLNHRHGTYAGEPLGSAMFELEDLVAAETEVRIYGVGLQGDGVGLGTFDEGLLEFGAFVSDGAAVSAADLSSLTSITTNLAADLTCATLQDGVPPIATISAPGPVVANDTTPAVVIDYSDLSGISAFGTTVQIDSLDITPSCTLTDSQMLCESPALAAGTHRLDVRLSDNFGNSTDVGLDFTSVFDDLTPPTVAITAPGAELFVSQPLTVSLTYADASGIEPDSLELQYDGSDVSDDCQPDASGALCTVDIEGSLGTHVLEATVADRSGNLATTSHTFQTVDRAPVVSLTDPVEGLVTDLTQLTVSGSVSGLPGTVEINGVAAVMNGQSFSATLDLVEGTNRLVATAVDVDGRAGSAAVTVRRDTQAPRLVIESPRPGDRIAADHITVAGTVSDIIPGATVNADDVMVTINGMPAAVNNRTFIVPDIPLTPGENEITGYVVDRAGNSAVTTLQVVRQDNPAGPRLEIVSGNNQSGPILTTLAAPLTVRLVDPAGQSLGNRPVEFTVSRGSGLLDDPADDSRSLQRLTAADGTVGLDFRLGSRTGEGFHRVLVTSPGVTTPVEFCATAQSTAAAKIDITMDPAPRGVVSQLLSDRLSVIVRDAGGNPVSGEAITFTVERGRGVVGHGDQTAAMAVVDTNADGIAEVEWTLGDVPGIDTQRVRADFQGNPGLPAVFIVSAIELGPPAETRIRGIVLNSLQEPIVGARATVGGTNLEAFTGSDGVFEVLDVPPGGHHVVVHGSSANDAANGVFYPDIEFAVEAISGHTNDLGQEVILPFLDMSGAQMVGGDDDVILTMDGVDGFAIKIFANSVILPDGSRGELLMSSSQVKLDKVPMAPPQGSTPFVVGTLQPGGIHFDPPAQVIYPNIAQLAPGEVADVFAFHHDIGQFVNIGPGTVSEDAEVVASDPGFGIVQSGWHCLIRQVGPPSACNKYCDVDVSWTPLDGGAMGGSGSEKLPVQLLAAEGAGSTRARVTLSFDPAGTLQGDWTAGGSNNPVNIQQSNGTTAIIGADGIGLGTALGPINVVPASPDPDVQCQYSVPVEVKDFQLNVVEVSFHNDHLILEDRIGQSPQRITDPVWIKRGSQPSKNEKVAYPNSKKISVSAKFAVDFDLTDPPTVTVRAHGPDGFEIPKTDLRYNPENQLFEVGPVFTKNNLPAGARRYDPLTIEWEFSLDGDDDHFVSAGSSSHPVLVTLSPGVFDRGIFLSILEIAVPESGVLDTKLAAFNHIWGKFSSGSTPTGIRNWNQQPLHYYKAGTSVAEQFCATEVGGLLEEGNGQCGSFTWLMGGALLASDIGWQRSQYDAPADSTGFLVKNWCFGEPLSDIPGPFQWRVELLATPDGIPLPPRPGYSNMLSLDGIPGQHSPTPAAKSFGNHVFLEVTESSIVSSYGEGPFFDPSYGLAYTNLDDFAQRAVDGFTVQESQRTIMINGQPREATTFRVLKADPSTAVDCSSIPGLQ